MTQDEKDEKALALIRSVAAELADSNKSEDINQAIQFALARRCIEQQYQIDHLLWGVGT